MNQPIYRLLSGKPGAGIEIRVLMRRTAGVFGAEVSGTGGVFGVEVAGAVGAGGAEAQETAGPCGAKAPGACGKPAAGKSAAGLPAEELLRRYARFTADVATRAIESGKDIKALRRELYLMARRMGSSLRRLLSPQNDRECLAIVTMLYRNIGITIREVRPGKFYVYKCYFSSFYTPEVCAVISAIDQGIFAGVCGGMLKFSDRITEGNDVCVAGLLRKRPQGTESPVRRRCTSHAGSISDKAGTPVRRRECEARRSRPQSCSRKERSEL